MKRFAIILIALPLLAVGLGILLQEAVFRALGERWTAYQTTSQKFLSPYLEDQKLLNEVAFFRLKSTGKDAGTLLNPLVRWGAGTTKARHLSGLEKSPIRVNEAIAQTLGGEPKTWLDLAEHFDYAPYNLSWMALAQAFDFWDITESPPAREAFEEAKARKVHLLTYFSRFPLPELKDVLTLAKIRLMKGIKEKNPVMALSQVRQLAKLSYSTETVYGGLMAVALLSAERSAYENAVARKLIGSGEWKPIPVDTQQRFKRVLMATAGFYSPLTAPPILSQDLASEQVTIGKCAAIREGTPWFAAVDRHLLPHVPLERDFQPVYDAAKAIALDPRNGCRGKDVAAYWVNPMAFRAWDYAMEGSFTPFGQHGKWNYVALAMTVYRLPYYRKAGGFYLSLIGTPSYFRAYESR